MNGINMLPFILSLSKDLISASLGEGVKNHSCSGSARTAFTPFNCDFRFIVTEAESSNGQYKERCLVDKGLTKCIDRIIV
jgi:hypothetical protein